MFLGISQPRIGSVFNQIFPFDVLGDIALDKLKPIAFDMPYVVTGTGDEVVHADDFVPSFQ